VILDLYSRLVVGWAMDQRLTVELAEQALTMALAHRNPQAGLLHHSDRGSQYAATRDQRLLGEHGLTPNMSRTGNCWDNACVERFFGTLKQKLDGWAVDGRGQLDLALADFRLWYNHVRPHRHLQGRTPAEAWSGIDPYATAPKDVRYFSAWDGLLTGFHIRR